MMYALSVGSKIALVVGGLFGGLAGWFVGRPGGVLVDWMVDALVGCLDGHGLAFLVG